MAKFTYRQNGLERTTLFVPPKKLADLVFDLGIEQDFPCAGKGICGKCRVQAYGALSPFTQEEIKQHLPPYVRLLCQTEAWGDCLCLPEKEEMPVKEEPLILGKVNYLKEKAPSLGACVDLGTTNLVFSVFNGKKLLARTQRENPQRRFGADVLSRLQQSQNGQPLHKILVKTVEDTLFSLLQALFPCEKESASFLKEIVFAGNTVMLTLLTGQAIDGMQTAPFPVREHFGKTIQGLLPSFPTCNCVLPFCASAFVGADLTCALWKTQLHLGKLPALLVDIGTNGEMALQTQTGRSVCSVPAGPAFEGTQLTFGMKMEKGALKEARLVEGVPVFLVEGGGRVQGICGSGALDLLSMLLDLGLVDHTGRLLKGRDGYGVLIKERQGEPAFFLPGSCVCLTQQDIRALQLAKAAVYAGVTTLLSSLNVQADQVETFFLAGAFGCALRRESMARVGLLPSVLAQKCQFVGNAALLGAQELLFSPKKQKEANALMQKAQPLSLALEERFKASYLSHLSFDA